MINITKAVGICNLGDSLNNVFENAINGVLLPHKINFELPNIENSEDNLRCNQIILHLYNQLKSNIDEKIKEYGKDKIGIVIATTNSGIEEYETTKNIEHLKMSAPAEYLKKLVGSTNYCCCISTACSSGVKAFSTAKRLLDNNICDCVIVGGTDAQSSFPNAGFKALEVLTQDLTNPFSRNRNGMNIGEAGALFILEKNKNGIKLLGIGETSDAYNAATPDPSAEQAKKAIKIALKEANLQSKDIDYINLHGTGTIANDLMEANAINEIFGENTPCSSTKVLTGHCLGAAASIEMALCIKVLEENKFLPHIYDNEYDETIAKIRLIKKDEKSSREIKNIMCNAFGFGGTNAVMIVGK